MYEKARSCCCIKRMGRSRKSTYKKFKRQAFFRNGKNIAIIAVIIIVLAAAAALIVISAKNKYADTYYSEEMGSPTLPTVTMDYNGRQINRIFGYTQEMPLQYMRDNIYVLEDGYDISINCQTYTNEIKDISFALYDLEENSLIQQGKAADLTQKNEFLTAVISIDNIISEEREYSLDIMITLSDGEEAHYYSRLIKSPESKLSSLMELVISHHEAIYNGDDELLTQYQQPNSAVNDNTNLGDISLNSNVAAMQWGTMDVQILTEAVISLVDIDNEIAFFRLDYQVGRSSDEGEEYYNVSEYYRTRAYGEKRLILSYQRDVEQIFVPDESMTGKKSVLLGISRSMEYETLNNAEKNLNIFVVDKAIWAMDTDTKTLIKIFSFGNDPLDLRENYDQHGIRLIKASDEELQYMVYGYMNSGIHEGKCGIGLYTYDYDEDKTTEEIFVVSKLPYQILKKSIGEECYLAENDTLYIMVDEALYSLTPETDEAELLIDGLKDESFKISGSGRYIAWQEEGKVNDARKICVRDLETGYTYNVTAEDGKAIKVLGFLGQDMVYGIGNKDDVYENSDGSSYLLMDELRIVDDSESIQFEEKSDHGYYISSEVEHNRVVINRVEKEEGEYVSSDEYTLFATSEEDYSEVSSYTVYDENRRTVSYLETINTMNSNHPLNIDDECCVILKNTEASSGSEMLLGEGKYYVYAAGEVKDILTSPAQAIMKAYKETGVVVTNDGGYFYKRTSRPNTSEISQASIDAAVKAYKNDDLINLTGIGLTQALYYTGEKIPLIWQWYEDTYIIYGYDLYDNLMLFNADTAETILVAYDDVDEVFETAGKCYIADE